MDKIKKAISTGKMVPKRDILSMVRYEGKGLKKLGFTIKEAGIKRWIGDKVVDAINKFKKNPIKTTAVVGGVTALDFLEPGKIIADKTNLKTKPYDEGIIPGVVDDFILQGYPLFSAILSGEAWKNIKKNTKTIAKTVKEEADNIGPPRSGWVERGSRGSSDVGPGKIDRRPQQ